MSDYDEFGHFHENLAEWGLDAPVPPVRRFFVAVDGLRQLSGLRWGEGDPELSLLHGGAQNAHTFDTVALALARPLVAFDLPGHGHSDDAPYGAAAITQHARDVSIALEEVVGVGRPLVGMSLGGLTALLVADRRPDLVRHLVMIDITPGVTARKARHITDFVNGPATFPDFDALLERTVAHNPGRSISSLRRGILHNAVRLPDGTWRWRHQRASTADLVPPDGPDLWERLGELAVPVTLVRAMGPGSVVDDEDEDEFRRRAPHAHIVHVADSGHSVQGDQPLVLARILEGVLEDPDR